MFLSVSVYGKVLPEKETRLNGIYLITEVFGKEIEKENIDKIVIDIVHLVGYARCKLCPLHLPSALSAH